MPRSVAEVEGVCLTNHTLTEAGRQCLPFTLTGAQERALDEILTDMSRPAPMMRLLQVHPIRRFAPRAHPNLASLWIKSA